MNRTCKLPYGIVRIIALTLCGGLGITLTFDILADGQSILNAPKDEFEKLMKRGLSKRRLNFGNDLLCYSPTGYPYKIQDHKHENRHNFASLSVTGESCSLNCEHCGGKLLKGMESTTTPELLLARAREIKSLGGEGILVSGGSDSRGHVPLERFGAALADIKAMGLQVVVHTGLVNEKTAQILGEAKIDAAMLDIIGDADVVKNVYHIDQGPQKMAHSLDLLIDNKVPITPHVLVGMNYGKLGGELEALDMIAQRNPQAVVIIALSPLRNTPMAEVPPPSPEIIGRVLTVARLGMEKTPLLLGCARPIGEHKILTDKFAIQAGANGIAYISQEGVGFARELGLSPVFMDICCSLAFLRLQ
ncbi:MAG: radical SAM protein [Candidatus Thorarchaeota archaeon]